MNVFRNMKIRNKLLSGFLIAVALTVLVGALGFIGLNILSANETALFEKDMEALYYAEEIEISLHQQRIAFRDQFINLDDEENFAPAVERLNRYRGNFEQAMEDYKNIMGEDEYYSALKSTYETQYIPHLEEYLAAIEAKDDALINQVLDEIPDTVDLVEEDITAMVDYTLSHADNTQAVDARLANVLMIAMAVLTVVAAVIGVALALVNAKLIATPTQGLVEAADRIAVGDLNIDVSKLKTRDEIGMLATSFETMANAFKEQELVLDAIANGDYTGSISVRSENDLVNKAISSMLDNNNSMISEIRQAAEQVAAGSAQIADGAQSLATGSTEQAATVEELSASITQVLSQAQDNSKMALNAVDEVSEAGRLMGESSESMNELNAAMNTINESSQNIAKVIKVIDDIAFQTNILALNAAVEAARAGQHGKGFAVVADEVRNLASKSAAAAKETADLIQNSVDNVEKGTGIAERTNDSLTQVGTIASANATSIQAISESSGQQSTAINEITEGINQISQVVQANSATAEESAASAQELSAQSAMLNKIVARFKLRDGVGGQALLPEQTSAGVPEYAPQGTQVTQASGEVIF
ncbi:methyl-accepting chemotaxis protein [Ruminococcaceae bacterium OttesenSCG-928-I18]|nr:methyl-accepting chemotaxis protein [Ruminococcaceae bacterium OttesenSCG-928-I18]